MAEGNIVLNGALVQCSMYPKPNYDKTDSRSFPYYEYVLADENAKEARLHSAYQGRNLILNEKDIFITPFFECRSPYYGGAVGDVINEYKIRLNKATGDEKKTLENLINTLNYALTQSEKDSGAHACAMLVLDKWFQASSANYVDSYYSEVTEVCESLYTIVNKIDQSIENLRKQYKADLPSVWECIGKGISSASLSDLDNFKVDKYFAYPDIHKMNQKFSSEANYRSACLDGFDNKRKDFRTARMELSRAMSWLSCDGEYLQEVGDNVDFSAVTTAIDGLLAFEEVFAPYGINDDFNKYIAELKDAKKTINSLKTMLNSFETTKVSLLTMDSKLVCRCGGVIKIVFNGSWIDESKGKAMDNLCNLLKKVEEDLYKQIVAIVIDTSIPDSYPSKNWPNKSKRHSLIGGFQLIHDILKELRGNSDYDDCPLLKEKGAISAVDISITPQSVIEESAARQSGVINLMGAIPFYHVGDIVTIISAVNSISSGEAGFGPVKDVFVELLVASDLANKGSSAALNSLASSAGNINSLYAFFLAVSDFAYVSKADYTGVITIVVKMPNYKYSYKETYNIYGDVLAYENPEYKYIGGPRDQIYWARGLDNRGKIKCEFRAAGISEVGEVTIDRSE